MSKPIRCLQDYNTKQTLQETCGFGTYEDLSCPEGWFQIDRLYCIVPLPRKYDDPNLLYELETESSSSSSEAVQEQSSSVSQSVSSQSSVEAVQNSSYSSSGASSSESIQIPNAPVLESPENIQIQASVSESSASSLENVETVQVDIMPILAFMLLIVGVVFVIFSTLKIIKK